MDLDYPSEDALGPQYCLQYSDSPRRTPQRPRVKEEPHKHSHVNDEPPQPSRIKDESPKSSGIKHESPKPSRTNEEPLDGKTLDVKPQVNQWAKYAGPSPFSTRPETSRMPFAANVLREVATNGAGWHKKELKPVEATPPSNPISQEPRSVFGTAAFISPQIERELSSNEDETSGKENKQNKQQLIVSSKRPSQTDGAEDRSLKRARRFV